MDSYFVQVQPRDELTVVIDKIINTQAARVYILVSENSRIAQSALNFRLIKREADTLGKEIIIVSSSPQVQNLALKSSLQVHLETPELRHGAEQSINASVEPSKISDVFVSAIPEKRSAALRESPTIVPVKTDKDQGIVKDNAIAQFWSNRLLRPSVPLLKAPRILLRFPNFRVVMFVLIGIAAIVSGATFYSVLPRAEVHITPLIEEVALEMVLTGDTNISRQDPGKFLVPAQIFEKTVSLEKNAVSSGEKEIREKASGTIKIYNGYSSSPQTLVKNTRFVSESGKLFRSAETIIVPGAEVENGKIMPNFMTTRIIASEPGEEYNIGPASFSVPGLKGTEKYLGFYGKSEQAMSGGKIGTVKMITEDNYNSARRALENELGSLAEQELNLLLPDGLTIPGDAKLVGEIKITSSGSIGDAANEFTLKGTRTIKAFAISERGITDMVNEDFLARFPEKRLLDFGEKPQYKVSKMDFKKGTLELALISSRKAYITIDPKDIVLHILGKREEDVRAYLGGLKNIKEAKITLWPFWVKEMPYDEAKIKVVIADTTP